MHHGTGNRSGGQTRGRFYNEEEMDYSDTNGGRYGGALRLWWKQRHFRGGGHHRSENGDGDDYSESGDRGADGQRGAEGRDYAAVLGNELRKRRRLLRDV